MSIVQQGNASDAGFSVMAADGLYFCDDIPDTYSVKSCQRVWSASSAGIDNSTLVGNGLSSPISGVVSLAASPMVSSQASSNTATSSSFSTASARSTSSVFSSSLPHSSSLGVVVTTTTKILVVTATHSISASTGTPSQQRTSSISTKGDDDNLEKPDGRDQNDNDDNVQHSLRRRGSVFGTISAVQVNGSTVVNINGLGWDNKTVTLARECLLALNWPLEK